MKDQIIIKDMFFQYDNKSIFSHFNLNIKRGDFITILGRNGSGKTTLACILNHEIIPDGTIEIIDFLEKVSFDCELYCDTLKEELKYALMQRGFKKTKIDQMILDCCLKLGIKDLLDYSCHLLSPSQRALFLITRSLIIQPKIIVLDDILSILDPFSRKKVLMYLKKMNRQDKTTIINITTSSDDSLYGREIAFLSSEKLINRGITKKVLEREKSFKEIGIEYPFLPDLSLKLKYYGLLDEIIIKDSKMVDLLWK